MATQVDAPALPSISEIQAKTLEKFGRRPCLWQCRAALAQLRGEKDVVCISGTGSGKTLTFWMPLLFRPDGIQVIITPLNVLGTQNRQQLERVGISAIAIRGETATAKNFQDIEDLKYRVVVVSPELAIKPTPGFGFDRLWRNPRFVDMMIATAFDEGHCVSTWGHFRDGYLQSARLRHILARPVTFYVPSATMPKHVLNDVTDILQISRQNMDLIRRSNDRPNVYLSVRKIQHSLASYRDLEFLIPDGWKPGVHIPKFLVFFDNIEESIKAAEVLQKRLPREYRDRLVWFNSNNSHEFREECTAAYLDGQLFGLFCTDSFGMGIDIPDIEIVVQWRTAADLCTIWQRFGRAARELCRTALAVLFVDAKYFDEEKAAAEKRAVKRKEAAARKATETERAKRPRGAEEDDLPSVSAAKRARTVAPGSREADRSAEMEVDDMELDDSEDEMWGQGVPSENISEAVQSTRAVPSDTAAALTPCERLRVLYQDAAPKPNQQRGRAKKTGLDGNLGPEVDNLVNAGSHTREIGCYRVPITAYFENDRAESDYQECVQGEAGCARCHIGASPVCCSLCSPSDPVFEILAGIPPRSRTQAPRASKVPNKYAMEPVDIEFRKAVHDFRRRQMEVKFGRTYLDALGPGLIMGDDTLSRIADCARASKLTTVEALYRETKWPRSTELGEQLLRVVNRHYPPATPFVSTPLAPRTPANAMSRAVPATPTPAARTSHDAARKPRKCSRCGKEGHIRSNTKCPLFPVTGGEEDDKENEPPESLNNAAEASGSRNDIPNGEVHTAVARPRPQPRPAVTTTYDLLFAEPSYRSRARIWTPPAPGGMSDSH